ncbi:hypothetical protein CYLTODRAFT_455567 [Cylindrobasidium torrendii FP15055 ss-10]|uniref:Uncharacterized protein n=1 Tax=Cylindrobasidium torrendii FP15055 ss-10 TaxID=1314674 RepID=A0A0D7B9P8_9AGAR|nr:hypothetical protein CYLTODRAFT_455567 [Cylindrobasidium torrendii FP15055 ss-10]
MTLQGPSIPLRRVSFPYTPSDRGSSYTAAMDQRTSQRARKTRYVPYPTPSASSSTPPRKRIPSRRSWLSSIEPIPVVTAPLKSHIPYEPISPSPSPPSQSQPSVSILATSAIIDRDSFTTPPPPSLPAHPPAAPGAPRKPSRRSLFPGRRLDFLFDGNTSSEQRKGPFGGLLGPPIVLMGE